MKEKRMAYPGSKDKAGDDKAGDDKAVWVNINVSDKDGNYLDGCVLKLVGSEIANSGGRGEYFFEARRVNM